MDNEIIEKLTKEIMSESRLELPDPLFDEKLMSSILLENTRMEERRQLFLNILVFIGVEFIILTLIWILPDLFSRYKLFYKCHKKFDATCQENREFFPPI